MPDAKKLNSNQLAAITHGSGPLLIIAGAGTGKTTVITERVKWLIEQKLAGPEELLCLTFTEKAAREMEERIDQALPYGYGQLWSLTFHSFCDRILRNEALHIGLDPSYKLMSEADGISLISEHIFSLPLNYYRPLGNPHKFISALLQHVSRLKDEDINPNAYAAWAETVIDPEEKSRYQELAALYQAYEELKVKNSLFDFSDLISHTLNLFRTRPNVLNEYQQKFKYILVDEYQDTNFAQTQLVNLLAQKNKNLTVVADDDQAIYRWRGAAVSNVLGFRSTYPESKLVVLTQNYRSTQEILDRSYRLIQNNNPDRLEVKEGIDKHLQSSRKRTGEPVSFLKFATADDEAEGVAKAIQEYLLKNPHMSYQDVAILVRANAHAHIFLRALDRHSIPAVFLGPTRLFDQPEIKDLLSYLRVLYNPFDNQSLYRLLASQFHPINSQDLIFLSALSKKANLELYEACEVILGLKKLPAGVAGIEVTAQTKTILEKLFTVIKSHLQVLTRDTTGHILYDYLSNMGLLTAMFENKSPFDPDKTLNITRLLEKISAYESVNPDALVPQTVGWLDLISELGDSPLAGEADMSAENAVKVLTIHASKGLEFSVVFVVNLVSQRFPSISRKEPIPIPDQLIKEMLPEGDFHIQEERRLCYVAVTRAKDKLFLTAADFYGDGKRQKQMSPFVAEMLGEDLNSTNQERASQLTLLDWRPITQPVIQTSNLPKTKIDYISYSQIQTFLDCPLHYKARYILKVPTPPSAPASFGNTIHLTLKDFYGWAGKNKDQLPGSAGLINHVLDIYMKNWTPVGFINKDQQGLYLDQGRKYLEDFVVSKFDPTNMPLKLEEPFTVPIRSSTNRLLKVGGKIDRVDQLPDGSIEIIDYKTGEKPMDQKQADKSLQLSVYALAATLLPQPPFNKPADKVKLSLYYFSTQETVSTTRTAEEIDAARTEIFNLVDEIESSSFECSHSPLCRSCEYKLLCTT